MGPQLVEPTGNTFPKPAPAFIVVDFVLDDVGEVGEVPLERLATDALSFHQDRGQPYFATIATLPPDEHWRSVPVVYQMHQSGTLQHAGQVNGRSVPVVYQKYTTRPGSTLPVHYKPENP